MVGKYCGKCKSCGELVYGSLVTMGNNPEFNYCKRAYIIPDDLSEALDAGELCFPNYTEVVFDSVCMWAGKEDACGIEIYANHRIRFAVFDHNGLDTQYVGTVKFNDGEWQLHNCNIHDGSFGNDGPFSLYWVMSQYDECKVIGTV